MCKNRISIIIPAYKPDEKLIATVNDLTDIGFDDIIIVNDGSDTSFDNILIVYKNKLWKINDSKLTLMKS